MNANKIHVLALAAVVALVGCGGSGGGGNQSASFPSGIYIGDYGNERLVRIGDMSGSGWTENTDNFGQICGIDFNAQNQILVAMANPEQIVQMNDLAGTGRIDNWGAGLGIQMFGNLKGVMNDSQGRMILVDGDPSKLRLVRLDDISDTSADIMDLSSYLEVSEDQFHAALDAQDRIYIIFRLSGKLLRFDNFEDTTPEVVGSTGTGVMQFNEPVDIHIDAQGRIYVAEYYGDRVVRFDDLNGANWVAFGVDGTGEGQFKNPTCITTDNQGRIYIGDGGVDRIVRIDDMTGTGWVSFGTSGSGVGELDAPWEIHVKE